MSYLDSTLKQLFPEDVCGSGLMEDGHNNADNTDIYEILNKTPGARKLMNVMFSKGKSTRSNSNRRSALYIEASKIAHKWFQEEFTENSRVPNTSALQSESHIIFSWSRNSRPNTPQAIALPTDGEKIEKLPPKKREPTSQKVYKCVYRELSKLESSEKSWQWVIHGVDDGGDGNNDTNDTILGGSSCPFGKSGFKVNPLATFVARELPRDKKKKKVPENSKDKKKSKRRSLLWFWGGSKKEKSLRDKHKKRDSRLEKFASNPVDIESFGDIDVENDELHQTEGYDEEERRDIHQSLDTNNTEFNTMDQFKRDVRRKESEDLLSGSGRNVVRHVPLPQSSSGQQIATRDTAEGADETEQSENESESDSDFGDFEIASLSQGGTGTTSNSKTELKTPSSNALAEQRPVSLLMDILSEPHVESRNTTSLPPMETFTPLQPRKKA